MSTTHSPKNTATAQGTTQVPAQRATGTDHEPVRSVAARKALAALRIAFGLTFLWAFFDKLLGLGFATGAVVNPDTGARTGIDFMAKGQAWLNGGSPTEGFLSFGVPAHNPFKDMFTSMAGQTWVDVLFMAALLGVGLTLTFGAGIRLGSISGALLYLSMWVAS